MLIASAAAVDSSSREALDIFMPTGRDRILVQGGGELNEEGAYEGREGGWIMCQGCGE